MGSPRAWMSDCTEAAITISLLTSLSFRAKVHHDEDSSMLVSARAEEGIMTGSTGVVPFLYSLELPVVFEQFRSADGATVTVSIERLAVLAEAEDGGQGLGVLAERCDASIAVSLVLVLDKLSALDQFYRGVGTYCVDSLLCEAHVEMLIISERTCLEVGLSRTLSSSFSLKGPSDWTWRVRGHVEIQYRQCC